MKIVRMDKNHIPSLCELERLCFSLPWSEKAFEDEIENPLAVFLVAEEERPLGYVGCLFVCGEGAVTNVAVFPEHRRKGVAKALLTALQAEAEKRDSERITLEVRKSNTSAIELYKKLSYTVCGERPNFYTKPTENAILMELKIGNQL